MAIPLLFPLQTFSAEQPVPETQQSDGLDIIDAPRNYLSGRIAGFAEDIDRFFGGDRHYQESNQSVVQLDLTHVTGYGGDHKYDLAARVNLRLPATEGRLHLLFETDPEQNTIQSSQNSTLLNNQTATTGSFGLAARYMKELENVWNLSFDWGIKFPIPPHPFVRARGSYATPLGDQWRMKTAESVYWFNNTGLGETTPLDLAQHLRDRRHHHRTAPNHRRLFVDQKADRHDREAILN